MIFFIWIAFFGVPTVCIAKLNRSQSKESPQFKILVSAATLTCISMHPIPVSKDAQKFAIANQRDFLYLSVRPPA